jgi:hypothetical protein
MIAAVLALVVAAAGTLWVVRRARAVPPAAAPAPTAATPAAPPVAAAAPAASLLDDIIRDGLTPDRARRLFTAVIGPLPGVQLAAGDRDPGAFDGTFAIQEIYRVWPYLTPEQRQAAAALIQPSTAAPAARLMGTDAHVRLASWTMPERMAILPAAFRAPDTNTPAYDYEDLAVGANTILSGHLGLPPIPFVIGVDYGTPTGTEYAHTISWWRATSVAEQFSDDAFKYERYVPIAGEFKHYLDNSCHITLWNQKFQTVNETDAQAILVHEMFHCYENRAAGTYEEMATVKPWIAEGEPTWAMAAAIPGVHAILDEFWNKYVFGPKTVYADRSYDGVGIFGHLSDLAGLDTVWSRLMPVFGAGLEGHDVSAFVTLIHGYDHDFYTSWGSSYFVDRDHAAWTIGGPGEPPTSGPAPSAITLYDGFNAGLAPAPQTTAETFSLSGDADVAVVALYSGYGRLHDSGYALDTELTPSASLSLCLKSGGCKCPDGSDGASLFTKPATLPLSIGLDGGNMTGQIGVLAASLGDYCKKPDDPRGPQNPGGGGGGGGGDGTPGGSDPPANPPGGAAYGDPHVETFDGARLEFQRVGEYILARSTVDDFIVEVRQVPVSTGRWASVNKAVATKIGGHRVTITMENGAEILRMDGADVTAKPPVLTGGTIRQALTSTGNDYTLEWPDGTVLYTHQLGLYGLNVRLVPSAGRRGSLEGLLGNDDGKPENDQRDVATLASAWLVPSAASLFDYLPGQSSATFVDPSFPDPSAAVPNRDAAERDCREEGITDPTLLQNCVLDFAVTNGFLFKRQYAHQQAVLAARAAFAPEAARAALPNRTVVMSGTIADARVTPSVPLTVQAGDVIYVAPPDCVDRDKDWWKTGTPVIFAELDDPGGKSLSARAGCEFGRYAFTSAGTYTMRVNARKNETGAYHIPIRFVRHDRVSTATYGQIISGTIEQPGAHDLYTFRAKAGDILQVAGAGCTLNAFIGVVRPEGQVLIGPNCNQGSVTKIDEDGTYQLLINSGDAGTGPYQFVFQGAPGRP